MNEVVLLLVLMTFSFATGMSIGMKHPYDTVADEIEKEVYVKEFGKQNGEEVFKCRSLNGTLLTNASRVACVIEGNKL